MDVNVSGIDCVKLRKEGDDLLLDSGHQSAYKAGYTMSYRECVETLSSTPTCTHCEILQSARPSFHRWMRITKSLSLNHRLIGIDALTPRCNTTNQVAIIKLHD